MPVKLDIFGNLFTHTSPLVAINCAERNSHLADGSDGAIDRGQCLADGLDGAIDRSQRPANGSPRVPQSRVPQSRSPIIIKSPNH